MSRARSHVGDYVVYLMVRVVICFIQMLSYGMARVARHLARLAYWLDRRHRLVALENLQRRCQS